MSFDLTNKNIKDTFQNLLQKTGSDGRLYDLQGNPVIDLRISGSIIAEEYVVSSSVTHLTTQTLSGSTRFGDTKDDLHQFTGSLIISGGTGGNVGRAGGGGSGYADESVTVVSTRLGGSTGDAKVILRIVS